MIELYIADLSRFISHLGKNRQVSTLLLYFFHPRMVPVLIYRLSYFLYVSRVPFLPFILGFINFAIFGIEIARFCKIGPGLFLPHTSGTVIGAVSIGANCTIFQNVTIGARFADVAVDYDARPMIGDSVTIGAGAKVLGGVKIDSNTMVRANQVVTYEP